MQDLQEEYGYNISGFIADFGGSLGFLLGVSILSVLEMGEGIGTAIYRYHKISKKRAQEAEKRRREENGKDETGHSVDSSGTATTISLSAAGRDTAAKKRKVCKF